MHSLCTRLPGRHFLATALIAFVLAAAFATPAPAASRPAGHRSKQPAVVVTTPTVLAARAVLRARLAAGQKQPRFYRVRRGDTLAKIARREYGNAGRWPALWWVNRHTVHNPSVLRAGERLRLSAWHPRRPWVTRAALAAIPQPPPAPASQSAGNSGTGYAVPAQPVNAAAGGFEQCVIQRESGGDPHAVNPSSGAGGLYQFLPSTWQSLGYSGLPQDAPVWEQRQAFDKLYAEAGAAPWSGSDGC